MALAITAANVLASATALRSSGIAGATITAGQPLYADPTDSSKLKPADSDASVATATVVGIALNNASAGQPVNYVTQDPDFTTGAAGMAVGIAYALSPTAGAIDPVANLAAPSVLTVLFVAKSTTKAVMKIVSGGVAIA